MAIQIQFRRDTAANWTSANPVLAQGEAGYETDTGKVKIGDGVTAWNSLAYNFFDHGSLDGLGDDDHSQYHNDSRADTWLSGKDTDDLAEGTNQYFTDERAQDAVGNILLDTSSIDFTYDDGTPNISAVVLPSGVDHDSLQNYDANEHIDHTGVTLTAGNGLSGGGDISASRTFDLDLNELTTETAVSTDYVSIVDVSDTNASKKALVSDIISAATGACLKLDTSNGPLTGNLGITKSNPKITLTDTATDSPTVYLEKLTTSDGSQLVSQNRRYQPANAISIVGTSGTMASAPSLTNFSYSFWLWSDGSAYQNLCCNGTNNINIRGPSSSPPYFRISGFGGSTIDFHGPAGQPALTGRWTHIVITRNASTGAWGFYYDGVASPQSGSICGTTTLSSFTVPTTTNGDLDEFICYDKVLSAGEIAALYNGGAPTRITSYTNVVWHWSADQSSGTTLTDNSSNGRNVTGITGATWITGKVAATTPEPLTDIPLVKITNNGITNSYGNLVYGYYTGSYGTDNYYDGLNHYHRVLGTTRLQVTSAGITVTGAATLSSITASTLTISGALTMAGVIQGATSITCSSGVWTNAGLVGTVAMGPSSDTNTGVWYPAPDTYAISTGGTERMRISSTGLVSLGSATTAAHSARLDIADGGVSLVIGANSSSTTRTNVTDKIGRIGGYHYTNAEEPLGLLVYNSMSTANIITIGGGSALLNAATQIYFNIGATTTTTTGSAIVLIDNNGLTMYDAKNIIFNSTTGSKIGSTSVEKLSLWGAIPIVQPSGANQAALTNSTGGSYDATLAAVTDTSASDQSAPINDNFTDVYTLLDEIRTALVNAGIIKGSA